MNEKELQEKIALYYSKLPPNVQTVFSGMEWLKTLENISQKYALNDEQKQTLGTETTLVLLGIIHLVEYEEILTNNMGLNPNSAERMFEEIEGSIIRNIRPQLVQAFEANKNGDGKEETVSQRNSDVRLEKLPGGFKDVVDESNYQGILYTISKEYNLNVTQMGILEKAVTDLITGNTQPNDFQKFLEGNIKLPYETVRKLVNDVNEEIFKKIRRGLINTNSSSPDLNESTLEANNDILNRAGIEVVPSNPPKNIEVRMEELGEGREEILEKIEKPSISPAAKEEPRPILAQKLFSPVKTQTIKTEHTLENITKSPDAPQKTPIPQKPNIKVDPYREIPE